MDKKYMLNNVKMFCAFRFIFILQLLYISQTATPGIWIENPGEKKDKKKLRCLLHN